MEQTVPEKLKLFKKYYLTPRPAKGPEKHEDFKIFLKKIDLNDYYHSLLKFKKSFAIKKLISISYKKKKYPIYQIDIKNNAKKKMLVFATTHGQEFASALVIPKLLKDIQKNKNYYEDWVIRIVSPINPVGLDYQSRYNEQGYDINRDFKKFSTLGAKLQRDSIIKFKPDIIISLHEGFGTDEGEFYIVNNPYVSKKLEIKIKEYLENNKVKIHKKNFAGQKIKHGRMKLGHFSIFMMNLFNIKSIETYTSKLKIPLITTESSWALKNIQKRVKPHILTIKAVIRNFIKK
jgi:hypothetical protein